MIEQKHLDDITVLGKRMIECGYRKWCIHIRIDEYKRLFACTHRLHNCNPRRYYKGIFGKSFSGFVVIKPDGRFSTKHLKQEKQEECWFTNV